MDGGGGGEGGVSKALCVEGVRSTRAFIFDLVAFGLVDAKKDLLLSSGLSRRPSRLGGNSTHTQERLRSRRNCPFCNGSGKLVCATCCGSGTFTKKLPGSETYSTLPCPSCSGQRYITCLNCRFGNNFLFVEDREISRSSTKFIWTRPLKIRLILKFHIISVSCGKTRNIYKTWCQKTPSADDVHAL